MVMDLKLMLVLAAVVATVYSYEPPSSLTCSSNGNYIAKFGSRQFDLKGCVKDKLRCIIGLPLACPEKTKKCYKYFWYNGEVCWTTFICKVTKSRYSPLCSKARRNIPDCDHITEDQSVNAQEDVRICEKDRFGVEHCRSLFEGQNELPMIQSDCFCIEDEEGNKICQPDNCDAGRPDPDSFELQ